MQIMCLTPAIKAISKITESSVNLGINDRSTRIPERIVHARNKTEMQKMVNPILVPLCIIRPAVKKPGYSIKVMMAHPLSPDVGIMREE